MVGTTDGDGEDGRKNGQWENLGLLPKDVSKKMAGRADGEGFSCCEQRTAGARMVRKEMRE